MKTDSFYQHASYRGAKLEVSSNRASLPANFDRQLSSAKVRHPVALFTGRNYSGDVAVLTGSTSRFSLIRGQNLNDRVRSIRYDPVRFRLNIVVGVDPQGNLPKSMDEVGRGVEQTNSIFGPFGIQVEADTIRTIEGLRYPMTAARQDALIGPHLRNDAINVLYFGGTQWMAEKWKWEAESILLRAAPGWSGALSAEVYTGANYGGTRTLLSADVSNVTVRFRSLRLGPGTHVTLFHRTNYMGDKIDLFHHEPDLDKVHRINNWWGGGLLGHCCHGPGRLCRLNHRSGDLTLAHEIGHWWGLNHESDVANLMFASSNGGRAITFEQAERVWKRSFSVAAIRAARI